MEKKIWFWQRSLSPHLAPVAGAMSNLGWNVTYVVESELNQSRRNLGWSEPELNDVEVMRPQDAERLISFAKSAPIDAIHVVQGLRSNGHLVEVTKILKQRSIKFWVVIETIKESWYSFLLKRFLYGVMIRQNRPHIAGFLAIGSSTANWLTHRGADRNTIHDFSYCTGHKPVKRKTPCKHTSDDRFRFIYVGQLIRRKRVDLIISALKRINNKQLISMTVIGSGIESKKLSLHAAKLTEVDITWHGSMGLEIIPLVLQEHDCFLLASDHDGFGVAALEALNAGLQVVCSDACGVSRIVANAPFGHVFKKGSLPELIKCMDNSVKIGKLSDDEKESIYRWAEHFSAQSIAARLNDFLNARC